MICTVKIFEEGTFIFVWSTRKMENVKEENIWSRKIYFLLRRSKMEEKKEANI